MSLRADLAGLYALEGLGDPRARWLVDLRDASGAGVRLDPWGEADDLVLSYHAWGKPTGVQIAADRITGTWSGGRAIYLDSRQEHPEANNPEVWPGLKITLHVPNNRVPAADADGKIRFRFPVVAGWEKYDFWQQPTEAGRPAHVVDSLAVYHKTKVNNGYTTGKACHLYRPFLRDSLGRFAWGAWEVDAAGQALVKAFPAAALTWAQWYDVDADMGYTSIGGTTSALGANLILACKVTAGSTGGTLSGIQAYMHADTTNATLGVYSDSSNYPGSLVEGSAGGAHTSTDWAARTLSTGTIDATTSYWLAMWASGSGAVYYYDAATQGRTSRTTTYSAGNLPATYPAGGTVSTTRKISIYASYTEGGGGTTYQGEATASLALTTEQASIGTFPSVATAAWVMATVQEATGTFPSTVTADMALTTTQVGGLVLQGEATAALAFTDTSAAIKAVFGEVTDSLVLTTTAAGRVDFSGVVTAGLGLATVVGTVATMLSTVSATVTLTTTQGGVVPGSEVAGDTVYTFVAGPITVRFTATEIERDFIAAPKGGMRVN